LSKKLILPTVLSLFSKGKKEEKVSIPSQKIEQKIEIEKEKKPEQLSKRKLQRMKGKKTRKNRGKRRQKK